MTLSEPEDDNFSSSHMDLDALAEAARLHHVSSEYCRAGPRHSPSRFMHLPWLAMHAFSTATADSPLRSTITNENLSRIDRFWRAALAQLGGRPFAVTPVRTKPERTHNPIDDTPKYIPMVLAETFFSSRGKGQKLNVALDCSGEASGLFEETSLKVLGRSDSDPFQTLVKVLSHPDWRATLMQPTGGEPDQWEESCRLDCR
jgi:hypothetical protein